MTGQDKREPPQCGNTGAGKVTTCARAIEMDDQPDTIEMQEAGVHRHQRPCTD
jgi:hypothetical protein